MDSSSGRGEDDSKTTPLAPPPPPPFLPPPNTDDSVAKKRSRPEWSSIPNVSTSLEVESATPVATALNLGTRSNISNLNTSSPSFHYRLSYQGDDDDDDSLAQFNDWTPPDSSYGAAIPIGGWIPKRIRRSIERSLGICIVVLIAYLIVTTSLRTERNKHNDTNGVYNNNNGGVDLDDDRYVPYDDLYAVQRRDDDEYEGEHENDDDDYFDDQEKDRDESGDADEDEEQHDEEEDGN